ncbi:MAG: ROK family glucokinase [Alkalibacterium gilvum]|uniref:Glucokinase n=1 Tax=Alkalibacterium gilvum TaxID=1130080 RepID=A0A1H6VD68_9LACT|nr:MULTISPECIES: ROK family glucokinase [Alkalibacterium]MDN6408872.1 ROK family glucokinase [Tetragenococcus halophilus]MDN6294294.1 ROK family glucokinase [Alkalibacterium sp.]MDN6295978.1 ROK family glucokinase [Alkalibacterium sp.]MDN6397818.1 ROK family glucokinase [Alkalibacterium sp.]MDN6729725.1 ROK family glucokinase [Alkalibacterium sp.]
MENKNIIGVDLGGTTIKFAITTREGEILEKWSIKTDPSDEGSHITPSIIHSINSYMSQNNLKASDFLGIGMGSPGTVNKKKGTVIGAYNLNWKTEQPLEEMIKGQTGIPLYIDNDANVAALGEQWVGAGNNEPDVVFITLGTGVGGGVIVNGELVHGEIGAAGEIGHMTVDPTGYECTCGKKGCLETVASATGIKRIATDDAASFEQDTPLKASVLAGDNINAKIILDAAKDGDAFGLAVIEKVSNYLGLACGNIANLLNPSTIIIGGGVSKAGEFLADYIRKYLAVYAFPTIRKSTKIRIAELSNDAGVIGASSLVLKEAIHKSNK